MAFIGAFAYIIFTLNQKNQKNMKKHKNYYVFMKN